MALIAAIAVNWTELENALVEMLFAVLGTAEQQGEKTVVGSGNWVARVALQQSETIRHRLKLLDATLTPVLAGSSIEGRWETIAKDLSRRSKERNKVVHGSWGYSDLVPNSLIYVSSKENELWSATDFEKVLERIAKTVRTVRKFQHEAMMARATGEITHPIF